MRTLLNSALSEIKKKQRFILSTHVNPDGDALGSLLAVARFLSVQGKEYEILCADAMPEGYCFLGGSWGAGDIDAFNFDGFDAAIIIDVPVRDRLGSVADIIEKAPFVINIDHHPGNELFGDINIVDENAAAAGELVYRLLSASNVKIDNFMAEALYVAIATDTGSFKYHNTTAQTHRIIADLVDAGVNVGELNVKLFASMPFKKVKLRGMLTDRIELGFNQRVGWCVLKRDDLEQLGATKEDADGFINVIRSIDSVEFVFFAVESEDRTETKVSFRSSGDAVVNSIAARFGGGGHARAAGCTVKLPADEAVAAVLTEIKRVLNWS